MDNGSPNSYIRYKRGLRQGDLLSPLLFILVTDALSSMFTHALKSKVLVSMPLGDFGSQCTNFEVNSTSIKRNDGPRN